MRPAEEPVSVWTKIGTVFTLFGLLLEAAAQLAKAAFFLAILFVLGWLLWVIAF
jgi:hypothetical protein